MYNPPFLTVKAKAPIKAAKPSCLIFAVKEAFRFTVANIPLKLDEGMFL